MPQGGTATTGDAQRRHLGAGCFVTRLPDGEGDGCRLRIDAPREQPGWRPRRWAEPTLPELAGTAVFFEDDLLEVVRAEPQSGAGWSYFLAPWDDAHPLRGMVVYGAEECRREAADRARRQRAQGVAAVLTVLAPLVALLPAADQRRLELELGFPAARGTLLGAVLALAGSFGVLVLGMSQTFGRGIDPGLAWAVDALPFALFFVIESLVRLWVALQLGEPMGSFPVWLPVSLVRGVRAARSTSRVRGSAALDDEDRQRRREMWVETLGPLFGLCDAATQERLASAVPSFDPRRATRASILATGAVALVGASSAGLYLASDPRSVDAAVLAFCSALGLDAW
jgi:hypothetical protein